MAQQEFDLSDIEDLLSDEGTASEVHLSDVFKYISHFRRKGHQIGRKVGDMLEVLTLAAVKRDAELSTRLLIEPYLEGFSSAKHKVEFGIFDGDQEALFAVNNGKKSKKKMEVRADHIHGLKGFIECKKVGVEQTINSTFKKKYSKGILPFGEVLEVNFRPRWAEPAQFKIQFKVEGDSCQVSVDGPEELSASYEVLAPFRLIFCLDVNGVPHFVDNERSLRDIPDPIRLCKTLEVNGFTDGGVECILNDCLAGPQTPEKAKQASFVALDVRKHRFGQFDKRADEREMVTINVLTEYSHWEPKSVNMVQACVDYNLVVLDSLIVAAMEAYEKSYGVDFLERITKDAYVTDEAVASISKKIMEELDGYIFMDSRANKICRLCWSDGGLTVEYQ
ncbi:hypothetical protein OCGS_0969 [Oceaniovalibus guishaninsula JLT2003]|uniref:Uncharacterized protein n=1 Tax=Oceaniovalibus guishaninsula JLT2003 TaxID=1231392 RepID=K2HQ22_9RHOB|nr:hypothetical protein [Oceaniovalibus guishaninsula]EKE44934.1 hypothetical protein OCGS_0969 [Oceaniovalibus guishaninsula JLT2003]